MECKTLISKIQYRINELKSEQIGLRPFIESDRMIWESLERAITELTWVLRTIETERE